MHDSQSRGERAFVCPSTPNASGHDDKKNAKNRKNHKNRTETTAGQKVEALAFFRRLKKRLSYLLARKGRPGVLDSVDSNIHPLESFVNYRLVERLFPHARRFTWWIFKNVEAQVGVAKNMEEHPNLSDDELYVVTMRICEDRFNKKGNNGLTSQERKQLAVTLKNDWYASNAQVARLSGLDLNAVNNLFPMAAKQK